ncbi:PREDICTED: uncharacterized protein LOC104825771 isoform X2 [Tarenaya hassleriana]|uniref:uncharacterized protein LOC104825771 isoform X2 n=1 Tax=Tarenaya hassleriana TaxID=28532 RepID=UPI00053CA657|nr:PREDICTED: uncharacterized protein LOC104825771 isoform X2 [Tarenaya hassleriana]
MSDPLLTDARSSATSSENEPSATPSLSFSNLDPYSNPLFLHAADTSSVSLITEKLTGEPNYNVWSRSMTKALNAKNKLGFIDGSIPPPSVSDLHFGSWSRCNDLVCTWLNNSVSSDIAGLVIYFDNARDIWVNLENRFKQKNVSKIYNIQQQLDLLHQGSLDLNSYYTKLNSLWEELKNHEPFPICTCKGCSCDLSGRWQELYDRRNVVKFLMRLNDSFTPARRQILMMEPVPNLTRAYNLIAQEEQQRIVVSSPSDSMVFQTSNANPRQSASSILGIPPSRQVSSVKPRPQCTHCGLIGHTVNRCFKIYGYPQGHKPAWSSKTQKKFQPLQSHVNMLSTQLKGLSTSTTDSNLAVPPPSSGPYSGIDDWKG